MGGKYPKTVYNPINQKVAKAWLITEGGEHLRTMVASSEMSGMLTTTGIMNHNFCCLFVFGLEVVRPRFYSRSDQHKNHFCFWEQPPLGRRRQISHATTFLMKTVMNHINNIPFNSYYRLSVFYYQITGSYPIFFIALLQQSFKRIWKSKWNLKNQTLQKKQKKRQLPTEREHS